MQQIFRALGLLSFCIGIVCLAFLGPAQAQQNDQAFASAMAALEQRNYEQAVAILEPLARNKDKDAALALGLLYEEGAPGFADNPKLAEEFYILAARGGDAEAQYRVAMLFSGTRLGNERHSDAFYWFTQAAKQGHVDAVYRLGISYLSGAGIARNNDRAISFLYWAAQNGSLDAMTTIGRGYKHGISLQQNNELALYWFDKAGQAGFKTAQGEADKLKNDGVSTRNLTPEIINAAAPPAPNIKIASDFTTSQTAQLFSQAQRAAISNRPTENAKPAAVDQAAAPPAEPAASEPVVVASANQTETPSKRVPPSERKKASASPTEAAPEQQPATPKPASGGSVFSIKGLLGNLTGKNSTANNDAASDAGSDAGSDDSDQDAMQSLEALASSSFAQTPNAAVPEQQNTDNQSPLGQSPLGQIPVKTEPLIAIPAKAEPAQAEPVKALPAIPVVQTAQVAVPTPNIKPNVNKLITEATKSSADASQTASQTASQAATPSALAQAAPQQEQPLVQIPVLPSNNNDFKGHVLWFGTYDNIPQAQRAWRDIASIDPNATSVMRPVALKVPTKNGPVLRLIVGTLESNALAWRICNVLKAQKPQLFCQARKL